jgi:hypothetical protein
MPVNVANNSSSSTSSSINSNSDTGDGVKKPSVIYNRLPRASVMLRLAVNDNADNEDYSELVTGASMSRPVAISDALALSPRAAPVPVPLLANDPLIESAAPLYASRALPLLAASSATSRAAISLRCRHCRRRLLL